MDQIFVTGFSVKAPKSDNSFEFLQNLMKSNDMTTPSRRYPAGYKDLPPRTGTIPNIDGFDYKFFKYNMKQSEKMDPAIRMLLEVSYESLMDSKIKISDLKGCRKTGVYVGHCFSDNLSYTSFFNMDKSGYELVNGAHSMAAHKLSYFYDIKGPSVVMDTACSSSLVSLEKAVSDIRNGIIDRAIVCGLSLTINPNVNECFHKFSMLSKDGRCFSFDERANGYCRSESIVSVVIERESVVSKINIPYCKILGTGVNSDGFKKKGITYPSNVDQAYLTNRVIKENNIDKNSVRYIEAHGTGTVAGDNEELTGLYNVYEECSDGIKIGSVKSNMGHAEGASGLTSMVKCLLMYDKKKIFGNHNFQKTSHKQIVDGKFTVSTETDDWVPSTIQINNFGFGGTNAVVFLEPIEYEENISETKETIKCFGNELSTEPSQEEVEWFNEQLQIGNMNFNKYINKSGLCRNIKNEIKDRKLVLVCPGQGSQWEGMGKAMFKENITFRNSIERMSKFYPDLISLYEDGTKWFDKDKTVIGIVTCQVGIYNCFKECGIKYDNVIGHSLGEICSTYIAGYIDEELAIKIAISRGELTKLCPRNSVLIVDKTKEEDNMIVKVEDFDKSKYDSSKYEFWYTEGVMAVVGLEADIVQSYIDKYEFNQTVIACYNSPKGQTLSGPKVEVLKLLECIKAEHDDCFIREVPTDGMAYHSKLLQIYEDEIRDIFLKHLNGSVIKSCDETVSSTGWLSTCGMEKHSLDYQIKNITNPVYFNQMVENLPSDSLIVEIGPSSGIISQIKRTRQDVCLLGFINRNKPEENVYNLSNIEEVLFENGYYKSSKDNITKSRKRVYECENLNKILWDHKKKVFVPSYEDYEIVNIKDGNSGKKIQYDIDGKWSSLSDHVVDGHNLFPAMGYIYMIWSEFEFETVKIKNVVIHNAYIIPDGAKTCGFKYKNENGRISIYGLDDDQLKVSAEVEVDCDFSEHAEEDVVSDEKAITSSQFYGWIRRLGYSYGDNYRLLSNVRDIDSKKYSGILETVDTNMIAYLDACLHLMLFKKDFMAFPVGFDSVKLSKNLTSEKDSSLHYDKINNILFNNVVEIHGTKMKASKYMYNTNAEIRQQVWVPFGKSMTLQQMFDYFPEISRLVFDSYMKITDEVLLEHIKDDDNFSKMFKTMKNYGIYETEKIDDAENTLSIRTLEYLHNETSVQENYVLVYDSQDDKPNVNDKIGDFKMTFSFGSWYLFAREFEVKLVENWHDLKQYVEGEQEHDEPERLKLSGIGAVSFMKTLYKEYPHLKHVLYADENEISDLSNNASFPFIQINTSNNEKGLWIEQPYLNTLKTKHEVGHHLEFKKPGFLDSATWIQTDKKSHTIKYSSLNFRDIMRAFGKLKEADLSVGLEFSGLDDKTGERVFGVAKECIGTHCEPMYCFKTPEDINDADAATIPIVYLTVYYSLFTKANLKRGDTVLIHAGTGGVGLAAINVCLKRGINVFTTCSTLKREWLKNKFPELKETNIGDSRSDSFVKTVMDGTDGKGVDCVLNSLSGNLQVSSIKCLSPGGSFCEIGKYDIIQNSNIAQGLLEKNISLHVIDLLPLLGNSKNKEMWDEMLQYGFDNDEIKPLPTIVYQQEDIIKAFRDMSQAKHKGKILIEFQNNDFELKDIQKTFIVGGQKHLITGGLGGLALVLAKRLAERGCNEIVLLSRSGVKNNWQQYQVSEIEKLCKVSIMRCDISEFSHCGHFDVIWHAATVYKDGLFSEMTQEQWDMVQNVKVGGYEKIRKSYPDTKIINFSSIVSYLGNGGQTNYAWANGNLDYVSHNDKNTLAMQFGAIDNVGFVSKNSDNLKILKNAADLELVRVDEILNFIEQTYHLENGIVSYYAVRSKDVISFDLSNWELIDTCGLITKVIGGSSDDILDSSSDTKMGDMGLDSLSRVELVNLISQIKPDSKKISVIEIDTMTPVSIHNYIIS